MKKTKTKTAPKRASKEKNAILKKLRAKSKDLSTFCIKHQIPLFLATQVDLGKHVGGITAINGKPHDIAACLHRSLEESPILKAFVMSSVIASKLDSIVGGKK